MDNHTKESVAGAAAAGTGLGTLYFTGITGLSASGITSGLATIGLGSMAVGATVGLPLVIAGGYYGSKYIISKYENDLTTENDND